MQTLRILQSHKERVDQLTSERNALQNQLRAPKEPLARSLQDLQNQLAVRDAEVRKLWVRLFFVRAGAKCLLLGRGAAHAVLRRAGAVPESEVGGAKSDDEITRG